MSTNIIKQTSYSNTSVCNNRPLKYIVIHYTAGTTSRTGTAYNTAVMFSNPSIYASADFIVDDATIVQFNPDIKNRYCWHCGDNKNYNKGGSYYGLCQNYNSIGIEVCSTNSTGRITNANDQYFNFTDAVVNKAIELTKYLMKIYNIPASNVIRHYDVTGKYCPGIIGWNADSGSDAKWKAFKAKLTDTASTTSTTTNNKTNTTTATKTSTTAINTDNLYRIRKTWSDSKSQIGAYKNLESAKSVADNNKGYYVFDSKGNIVYPKTTSTNSFKSYTVKITADVLNVRKGAGISYAVVTTVKQNEVYTIVDENNGWGLLKAYKSGRNGWISLAYTQK